MSYEDLKVQIPGSVGQLSKLAQMDVQVEQLEQDFSQLAYMFVADKAAQMMRYLLGFEVVEHEPDGSKAVGVFGFKIGNDYYYVPAFFVTNQVRGVDMIFSKKTNMFVPLTEEWVDNITSRDAIVLGDMADAKTVQRDFENPNFDFVKRPNIGAAYSSKAAEAADAAGYDEFEEGKSLFKSAWYAMCRTTAEKLATDKDLQEAVNGFVGAINGKELSKKAEAGDLTRWLSEQGGPGAVASLFDALCTSVKFANAALQVHPDIESLYVHQFRDTAVGCKRAERAKLSIVEEANDGTSDEDRQRLLVNGFYIDDNRDAQGLSRVYQYDHEATFTTPDGPGKYNVLTADGTTQKAWILDAIDTQQTKRHRFVMTDPVGKCKLRGVANGDKPYVKGQRLAEVDSLWDTAMPLSQMAEGYSYVLIDKSGKNCIVGFRVSGASYTPGENDKVNGWLSSGCCDSYCDCSPMWRNKADSEFDIYRNDPYRDRKGRLLPEYSAKQPFRGLTLTKSTGRAVVAGDRIRVPSNYRAIVIDAPWDERHSRGSDGKEVTEEQPTISLGDITALRFEMEKAAFHDLTVLKDGPEYYIRIGGFKASRPMSYKAACCSLNGRLGLSVADTEDLLAKSAEAGPDGYTTHIHLGKCAQFVGAQMPMPPPEAASVDPYTGTPMYGPYEVQAVAPLVGAPRYPHGNPYGENLGGEGEMQQRTGGSPDISGAPGGDSGAFPIDQEAMDLATQAAQLGQRHVFDYASIGGLAKVYDTGSLIDSYIPQFMQAVDRLGRVLFLYYWKNEDFGERYGTSETVEMEDTLRSVFKQFGNLALTLRKKTVDVD